ncbi:acyltransferase family protein [Rosenbergiella collisarenosi]|uniref:acyltransferase family protein n=1 Tax=Rosenbergiella collisarenosi TaxID=1544695 RepID=UPI001F4EA408|nr:acyltransferase [Rosenbergiella collisarenosi]
MVTKKLDSIQAVRAIAILLVVGWHIAVKANVLGYTDSALFFIGNAGVDIFFVVSGFIMALCVQNSGRKNFFSKRFIRILPLYWLITLVALIAYCINPHLVNSHAASTTILHSFTLIPIQESAMLVDVGWTLRYELFFYFILWVSLLAAPKHALKLCSAIILLLVGVGVVGEHSFYKDFLTNPLIVEFVYGIVAFQACKWLKTDSNKMGIAIFAFGIACLIIFSHFNIGQHRCITFGIPAFIVVTGASLVDISGLKGFKLFNGIGNASYSIYLTHMFSLGFVIIIAKWLNLSSFVALSVWIALAGGMFTYYLIEKNVLRALRSKLRIN